MPSLLTAIQEERWDEARRLLHLLSIKNYVRQMEFVSLEGHHVTILHLLCYYNAPLEIVRTVLDIQPLLAYKQSSHGEFPLHYSVARVCLDKTCNLEVVQLLIQANPGAMYQMSSSNGRFGSYQFPLDICISLGGPLNLMALLRSDGTIPPTRFNYVSSFLCTKVALFHKEVQKRGGYTVTFGKPLIHGTLATGCIYGVMTSIRPTRLQFDGILRAYVGGFWQCFDMIGRACFAYTAMQVLRYSWIGRENYDDKDDTMSTTETLKTTTSQPKDETPVTVFYASGRPLHNSSTSTGPHEYCTICWDKVSNHVLLPCGHICLCANCCSRLADLKHQCPICKGHVHRAYKVYRSKDDKCRVNAP